ncbi:hypothetical protein FNV43_RR12980 [Rhamnella rubrinervis]|uniref:Uncharacterized protein n=1 Tax=Rhamnella rubrinervis TaxID=2594499 RepID=A0A8K0H0D7_9ROSA|nr:hypothetical protein FNV43_RR12980 [Rhamnella rubrinervis]
MADIRILIPYKTANQTYYFVGNQCSRHTIRKVGYVRKISNLCKMAKWTGYLRGSSLHCKLSRIRTYNKAGRICCIAGMNSQSVWYSTLPDGKSNIWFCRAIV